MIKRPTVSVGLPVFNGGPQLNMAINSILAQSFTNFELIICDNASTDDTEMIASKAASIDSRIKYIRNPINLGLFGNFDLALKESRGEFFMWVAHDDLHSKDFIFECVEKLQKNQTAALCQTRVAVCLESPEQIIYFADFKSFEGKLSLASRYSEALYNFPAVGLYGVYRSSIAKSIPGFRKIPGGDLLWVQELSLKGSFIQSEKILFHYIARKEWNSFQMDLKNLGHDSKYFKYPIAIAFISFLDRVGSIVRCKTSWTSKLKLLTVLTNYTLQTLCIRTILKSLSYLQKWRCALGLKDRIYWRFLHSPNIEIADRDLFQQRIINPIC